MRAMVLIVHTQSVCAEWDVVADSTDERDCSFHSRRYHVKKNKTQMKT